MASLFSKLSKRSSHWMIQGYDSTTLVYEAVVPGNMIEQELIAMLQRLYCKNLTDDEIVRASLRKDKRIPLLQPQINTGRPYSITVGHSVHYVATWWKAGVRPPITEDLSPPSTASA